MLKKLFCLVLAAAMIFCVGSSALTATEVSAGYEFEERILYGGTSVDVDGMVYFSDSEGIHRRFPGETDSVTVCPVEGRYLNYFDSRLWFVSENGVLSCNRDGSGLTLELEGQGISHLYVFEEGFYFLRDETVLFFDGKTEKELFSREGMVGFIPQKDGSFKWMTENPDYVCVPETGDEYWGGESEYLFFVTDGDGNGDVPLGETLFSASVETYDSAIDYTGPYVKVGAVTLPLEQHMPGTYFSKNGQACTCHHTSATFCIDNSDGCNCMRYYPTGKKETCDVDLLGAQCFAFARMIFYTCFGFIDHSMNGSLYYSVGSLSAGNVTASTVKELLKNAAPGAHIRLAAGHSVSILTMDEDFIVIYHGNAGGDGVTSSPCVVSTRRYTWEQFATACARGILYVNMPYNYPDSSVLLTGKETGFYRLKSNLNLRAEPTTQAESLGVVPINSIVKVTEVDGFWGKLEYDGKTGWIFLEYTVYYSKDAITPTGDVLSIDPETGYLVGKAWRMDFDAFMECFDKQSITVLDKNGNDISAVGGYVGTGCVAVICVEDEEIQRMEIAVTGDTNGNGYIDIGDYMMIRRNILSTYELNGAYRKAADVSGDGALSASDYVAVKRYFLGNMSGI